MLSLPIGLWVIWIIVLIVLVLEYRVRGVFCVLLSFTSYMVVRAISPQLGPWEQWGIYLGVTTLSTLSYLISTFNTGRRRW